MNKFHFFLTILLTDLMGAFTNLQAQEPAELGNYRIAKIGEAQNTFKEGQWYLMGRNPYLGSAQNAYLYENQ